MFCTDVIQIEFLIGVILHRSNDTNKKKEKKNIDIHTI